MYKFGVSVYPEQVTIEEIESYLKLASSYGFTKVFSSMFSIPGTNEEIIAYFKNFVNLAHSYNMEVTADVNTMFLKQIGATPDDLSIFKEIGIDALRMDMPFGDERDVQLVNNTLGIKLEFNSTMEEKLDKMLANGAKVENINTCHNFYPQRYTGIDVTSFNKTNAYLKTINLDVSAFVSSNADKAHGPWPVYDGLPTLEEHRFLPIDLQVRHMIALGNVDEIIIGNAFATEQEFKSIKDVMDEINQTSTIESNPIFNMILKLVPDFGKRKVVINIEPEKDLSSAEKEILFDIKIHSDIGDGGYYMFRSRLSRFTHKEASIPLRKCNNTHFKRGDVVIVNDNLKHYRGELQLVLKDMEVDGQRNLVGRIKDEELMLIDAIQTGDIFIFKK